VVEEKVVKASIYEITSLGVMTIKFNTPMKNETVNTTHINSTVVDIYIEPAEERHLAPGFDLSQLNFTWNVTEYADDELRIKLNFTKALSISPMLVQDRLIFHVKDKRDFFISSTYLDDLHDNYTTLAKSIKK